MVPSAQSQQVIARLDAGATLETEEVLQLHASPDLIPDLMRVMEQRPAQFRRPALELLVDLGRPVVSAHDDVPQLLAPYVDQPQVVAALIAALVDADDQVRTAASTTLATEVPADLIRPRADAVIEAVRRFPATDGAALVLGNAGGADAVQLIATLAPLRDFAPEDTEIALARLGDHAAEARVLREYHEATDLQDKAVHARRLGYIGSNGAVVALASDIRTSAFYVWHGRARRSMRLHVIEGLHRAYLREPVFWKPLFKPENDTYYEQIEHWLIEHLHVTWATSRPSFLYEEDAPIE